MRNSIRLLLLLLLLPGVGQAQNAVINELMPANFQTIADEDSEYSDWLEIYNPAAVPVDLSGYGLSDDPDSINKWIFTQVTIPANQFLVIYASGKDRRLWVNHWETVIDQGDSCYYRINDSATPVNWYQPGYDDSGWLRGPSGFGYGDDDDATIVPAVMSVSIRRKFDIPDLNNIVTAMLHVDYDDGFVAYLNGTEIARRNLGTAGIVPAYDLPTDTWIEASMYQGGQPEIFDSPDIAGLLQTGENVLALEVHNSSITSSDLTLIPFFTLGMKSAPADPRGISELLQFSMPRLHANFKLSAAGEYVFLSDTGGIIVDSVFTGSIPQDISLGRQPDGSNDWFLFPIATPGQPNVTPGYTEITNEPVLSLPAGFYPAAQSLTLSSSSPAAVIRYTIDGSVPDSNSARYTTAMAITVNTVIRARAFENGKLPSKILTSSYFINENITLPVVSLSTNPENFWDEDSGIYVLGKYAEPDNPYFGANFWQPWEKPVHVEFFEADGQCGFSIDAGVQITGAWSRANPQKSLAIFARKKYGADGITYQLFPDKPITEFQAFVLRNSGNDWNYAFLRDALITTLISGRGIDVQAYRPVVVFLNGEYWGIHDLRERVNEHFLAANHDVDPDNVEVLQNNSEVVHGDAEHYQNMILFLETNDINDSLNYVSLQQMMDVDDFLNYEITQIYCDNTDWPGNNIKYWREKSSSGKWRWIMYDTDFGFGIYDRNPFKNTLEFATTANGSDWPNPPWSTFLLRKLLENENFKTEFINRTADLLNAELSIDSITRCVDSLKAPLLPEMTRHTDRWGLSYSNWESNVDYLYTFTQARLAPLRQHVINKFTLAGLVQIQLNASAGGKIKINSLTIDGFPRQAYWQGTYFKGIPIRITAEPQPGYAFAGWQGAQISENPELVYTPQSNTSFHAFFVEDGMPVVMNEINYNSSTDFDVEDWIEFYNRSSTTVDLSFWQFRDSDDMHNFIFPAGTLLDPDSYLVVCHYSGMFKKKFPGVPFFPDTLTFGLSGGGESLYLLDNQGIMIDSLTYDDVLPWPPEADGGGPTLALKNPDLDNSLPENWAASANHGTPGQKNDVYTDIRPETPGIPDRFSLEQNYPNPFNPKTTIRFQLPSGGMVRLQIFDIQARLVDRIIDNRLPAGEYRVTWQPDFNLASGVYFYRLEVKDRFQVTKKMILLR
jgi:hypothetical protein